MVNGLTLNCIGDIEFVLGSISGNADFQIVATVNLNVDFGWISPNFETTPPTNVTVESCMATIVSSLADVSNLMTSGVPAELTPTLEGLLDDLIGDTISSQGSQRTYE